MTCARCGSEGFGCYECTPDPFAEIERLTAERDAALERLRRPVDPAVWQPIDDAPYDTPLTIRVGGMTFGAILRRGVSETTDGDPCDQWQALIADEHPPCWTDGACWEINADGYGSREPEAWRTIAAQTPPEDVGPDHYDRGRRDMLNAILALNPAADALCAEMHGRTPDPHGKLPFDVLLWVTIVAEQLGIEPKVDPLAKQGGA